MAINFTHDVSFKFTLEVTSIQLRLRENSKDTPSEKFSMYLTQSRAVDIQKGKCQVLWNLI